MKTPRKLLHYDVLFSFFYKKNFEPYSTARRTFERDDVLSRKKYVSNSYEIYN